MPLLNYSTKIPAEKTAGQIVALLARQGASEIMMVYDAGTVTGISWMINTPNGVLPFRLPIDEEAVRLVLNKQYRRHQLPRSVLADGQARTRRRSSRSTLREFFDLWQDDRPGGEIIVVLCLAILDDCKVALGPF